MANICTVFLLRSKTVDNVVKKFPITDYSNVFYDANHGSLQDTIDKFKTYCTQTEGTDLFNISNVDFTNGYFKVSKKYSAANDYNYCLIYDAHDNKWYCCFINSVTWDSNLTVATFNFEIDIFHTYIKEVSFKKCFIEREHVSTADDTFGKYILDEGIGVSDYVSVSTESFGNISYKKAMVIADTTLFTNIGDTVRDIVNVSATELSCCIVTVENSANGEEEFNEFFNQMIMQNKSNSIVAMYYIPSEYVNDSYFQRAEYNKVVGSQMTSGYAYISKNNTSALTFNTKTINRLFNAHGNNNTITYPDGRQLTIRNNKSLIYPFNFIEVSNNVGGKIKANFELSNSHSSITVKYANSILQGATGYLYLQNYDGIGTNMEKSITNIQNPELPYIHYTYGAYMASNRNQLANSIEYIQRDKELALFNNEVDTVQTQVGQTVNMFSAAAVENVGGFMSNLGGMIQSEVDYRQTKNNITYNATKAQSAVDAKLRDIKTSGNTAVGVFSTNGSLMLNKTGYSYYYYVAQYELLKTVDDYFSKFGYKINDYRQPALNNRAHFNYVKCSEVNLTANIPAKYIEIFKAIFSQGVTLWHNLDDFYNYDFSTNV